MSDKKKMSVVTEFAIFAIGLPVLMGLAAAMLASSLAGESGPTIMGVSRGLFIAVTILGAGSFLLVFGVLLLLTRKVWAVVGCVVSGYLIALAYCGVMAILTGTVGINLLTGVFVLIPTLLTVRSGKAMAELRGAAATDPQPTPPPLPSASKELF